MHAFTKNTTLRSLENGCKTALYQLRGRPCKNTFCLLLSLLVCVSTAELLIASLKDFKECDRVRCTTAHAAGMEGGGGKKRVSPQGATSSPILS